VLEAADNGSPIRETLKATGAAKESGLVPPCLHDQLTDLSEKWMYGGPSFN
jgi:hypothetical protein